MAVKSRNNWLSQQRVDVPHLKAADDSVIFDFKSLLQGFIADSPYILRGFSVDSASSYINNSASSVQIKVDSAVVWMPSQAEGSFLRVPSGTANETLNSANAKVSGSFTANATNYVSVQFTRASDAATNDLVAFWSVDSKVEFNKTVPLGLILNYQFVINTTGFGSNSPVAIVKTDSANKITQITNAKNSLFRLGKGGSAPNTDYSWAYSSTSENPLTVTTVGGADPYAGADWDISTFKDWMDAVMSEIKNMKGSAYWYSPGSSSLPGVNMLDSWLDANGSTVTGAGKFVHDGTTPGLLTWSSNIFIKSIIGKLYYTVSAGGISLNEGDVAYVRLARDEDFQPANSFTFTNGNVTVTSTITISGISAGDWIKFDGHDMSKWERVQSVGGTSMTLESAYQGITVTGKALRSQGVYTMLSAAPLSVPVSSDVFWFAKRDDNAIATATIAAAVASGAQRATDNATITTTGPHGLSVGQVISVTGVSDSSFNAVAEVRSAPTTTTFTYLNPGPDVGSGSAGSGTVNSRARIYLRAIGELSQGEERQIDNNSVINLLKFVGSPTETSTTPPYTITTNGLSSHQFTMNSDLTEAVSAITGNVNDIFTTLDQPSYDEDVSVVSSGSLVVLGASNPAGITGGYSGAISSFTYPYNIAIPFRFLSSQTLNEIHVWFAGVASTPTIQMALYSDNAGEPGTLITTSPDIFNTASLTATSTETTFTFTPTPIGGATAYWAVMTLLGTGVVSINIQGSASDIGGAGVAKSYWGGPWISTPTDTLFISAYLRAGIYVSSGLGTNELLAPVTSGTTLTLPLNSRLTGSPQQYYVVGKGALELYLNGQFLLEGTDWSTVGASLSVSDQVIINQGLVAGDKLSFRLDATGGPGSGGSGAPDDNMHTLPAEVTADNNDEVLIYHVASSAYRKQTRANFLSGLNGTVNTATYTANQTLTSSDGVALVNATTGNITITLPAPASVAGRIFYIKKIDSSSNSVILNPGAYLLDGASSFSFNIQYQSFTIVSNGTGYWIL